MQPRVKNEKTGRYLKKGSRTYKKYVYKKKKKNDCNADVIYENTDKLFHEKWYKGRQMKNLPHPFRCILSGPPGSGKTNVILNLLVKNEPYFKEVIVIHCDAEYTTEYDDVSARMLSDIPSPKEFDCKLKSFVIIDDIDYLRLPKEQKTNLNRLFGYVSTHKNISVCLTAQDIFNIPCGVRRCSDVWILWQMNDLDAVSKLGRKINYTASQIKELFDKYIHDAHDYIMFDMTKNSPYPLRLNGHQIIEC